MRARRFALLLAAPGLAFSLAGCISLFPKSMPDQLYSFGAPVEPAAAADTALPGPGSVGVLLSAVEFPRAATGDGILTRTGTQDAYLAQSRWVGPASLLFKEALIRSYDGAAQHSRLMARGEQGHVGLILRVDVRDFEAVYSGAPATPPVVAVSFRARLTRPNGELAAERIFDVRQPASDNRAGPIVAAFDGAVSQALSGLAGWVDQAAAALPPEVSAMPPVVTRSTTTTTSRVTTTGR